MKALTLYCGSADSVHPEYLDAAKHMGSTLARRGLALVFGGGKTGLMGALADGTLAAGGQVIGVITEAMNTPALAHAGLTRLEVTPTIHERKARMYELGDGFIALPGGFGTFDELFETITWAQIGLHEKPIGLFNPRGYFDFLMRAIDHAAAEGFIFPEHRQMLSISNNAEDLLDLMAKHEHPRAAVKRWMREE
jgi:hypothetical protein